MPAARRAHSASLDDLEPPEFEPAYPRRRFDGWTPERQEAFIPALADSACVADACRAVGMSERSAYSQRARADAVPRRSTRSSAPCRNNLHGQCEHWDHSDPRSIVAFPAPAFRQSGLHRFTNSW